MSAVEQNPYTPDRPTTNSLSRREGLLVIKGEKTLSRQQDKEDIRNCQPQIDALTKLGYARNEAEDIALTSLRLFDDIPIAKRKKGDKFYYEGDPAWSAVLLRNGHALVYNEGQNGNLRHISEIADSITILGDEIFHSEQTRESTTEAFTDCNIQILRTTIFMESLRQEPKLRIFLLASQSIRKQQLNIRMLELSSKPAPRRIASAILELTKRAENLPSHITQELVAELAGCSRRSVSNEVVYLQEQGILRWERSLGPQQVDEERLQNITRKR